MMIGASIAVLVLAANAPDMIPQVDAAREIAACVLKKDRKDAVTIAASEPATPAFGKAARKIDPVLVNCLTPSIRTLNIRINDLRGAFAELLLTENGGAELARVRDLPALAPRRITLGKSEPANDAALFRCVSEAAPRQAGSLLEMQPGSAEERDAFGQLSTALQGCVPQDTAMHLKPFQIRLLIAAALYGRLAAPAGA
ncbi:MAG: hypothetical protein K2X68_03545 [Novosphingobium sp.]|nr:hypothetical protein [Novosphingobium sp.]